MNAQFDGAVEDTIVAGDDNLAHIDIHLVGDDISEVVEYSLAVDALNMDGGIEELTLMHVPFGIEDAIAKTGFQLGGNRTGALVNLNAVLVVNISKNVVARNGVTASWEDILLDVLVVDIDGFFLVEPFFDNDVFFLVVFLCVF